MKQKLAKLEEPVYAALRIVIGFLLTWHGAQKLFGVFAPAAMSFSDKPQLWIGGLIEFLCGVAVALGIFTRWAAFLASGTMAVAYFQFHVGGDLSPSHLLPIVNKGELAVAYCFVFLYFATRGPGPLSLDRTLGLDNGARS